MKTLALALLITISSFSFAQNNSNQSNAITFNVEVEDGVSVLNWESNKEVNTSYYQIERSVNGEEFKVLGTQKAGSSTYQITNYSYEDVEEYASANYRITLVMMDGTAITTLANNFQDQNFASVVSK